MKSIINLLNQIVREAFYICGYDNTNVYVQESNRPDLCDYQCNSALLLAGKLNKKPIDIGNEIKEYIKENVHFSVKLVKPGFLNFKLKDHFIRNCLNTMIKDKNFGVCYPNMKKKIVIDYGGPNIAKPLHVGHLRPAIIGECLKRMGVYLGHHMIGDVHLGDWGLPIGLVINELMEMFPIIKNELIIKNVYISLDFITVDLLEDIYPIASKKSKTDENYKAKATEITLELQNGNEKYKYLWEHIVNLSVLDLKKNYKELDINFELWNKESDSQKYVSDMVSYFLEHKYAYISEEAVVVDVKLPSDSRDIPPCIVLKSNKASIYTTTELATIIDRVKHINPDEIIYVVDNRQELHFEQVFRCARKTHIIPDNTKLVFVGFGTVNGKDGKPYKTRDGGTMRLNSLINEVVGEVREVLQHRRNDLLISEQKEIAKDIAISAIKYGDLSNRISKDYIFEMDKFTSFEGNTGPYILYTAVRINSLYKKFTKTSIVLGDEISYNISDFRDLALQLLKFNGLIEKAFEDLNPQILTSYIYKLATLVNNIYHSENIILLSDVSKKCDLMNVLLLSNNILEVCSSILGMKIPSKM
ncbi:MAG: arginine--tRNA ligase [Firmicutes bacterium]|nr:arginine--tRNA ligase [Bacillota bacterium]